MELQTNTTEKKSYHTPELKDLGKIGKVTNTNGNGGSGLDGGTTLPNVYTS